MTRVYTDIWNDFQFRAPSYLDGHFEPYKFDLVKWHDHSPIEGFDLYSGNKEIITKSCFTVGTLIWDEKDYYFEFKSCGLRYLRHRVDGLEQFIFDFCESMGKQLCGDSFNMNYLE